MSINITDANNIDVTIAVTIELALKFSVTVTIDFDFNGTNQQTTFSMVKKV